MRKKLLEKLIYEKPDVKIFDLQMEGFFCTSIRPQKEGSEVEDWDEDEEKEYEIEI